MTQAAPFSISRVFAAPRSLVYEVHTKPEHLGRWLGPAGFETISCTLDFRVGGHYHYGLRGPQGMEMWGRQTYLEIVPGERLVYLQSFSTPDGSVARHPMSPTWPLEMHATVTFEDAAPGQTRVTVSWQPHNSDAEGNAAFDGARAGMTGGFTSSLWVDPERKTAIAVLSNAGGKTPDDIALHMLEPSIPIKAVVRPQVAISVDPQTLAPYVGSYRLAPGFDVAVRLREGRLFAQATGQNEFELFAKSATAFFARVTELEVVFGEVKDGRAVSFALTQAGRTRTAPRIE